MNNLVLIFAFLSLDYQLSAIGSDPATFAVSQPCILRQTQMPAVKARLKAGDEELLPIYQELINDAEQKLLLGPYSVMQKGGVPPSGDKHDYMSVGPYWWPDPNQPDGLPYIRRDGEVNPEYESADLDKRAWSNMVDAVETLTLAYYFSGRDQFAERAAFLLRAWFLNPETKMNPNLEFGQAIPGRVTGRGIGIIETVSLIRVVNAVELIASSDAWTEADHVGMTAWCKAYLDWLRNSPNGRDEDKTSNNHATWYDAQVARLAIFTGDQDLARTVLENVKKRRIPRQIEADGRQPLELERTKSLSYSTMNLKGMFELARLADLLGIDLWHFQTPSGSSLKAALDYLTPYADPNRVWPHTQIARTDPGSLYVLLSDGARHYHDPRYGRAIKQLPQESMATNRNRLIFQP